MAFHINGHDGHMAILCGLAIDHIGTGQKQESYSTIQPAEDGSGAQKVFSDNKFAAFNPICFAL
jgi:metal-dependent amidase/aminoacylase/carboxypeptidase family protein